MTGLRTSYVFHCNGALVGDLMEASFKMSFSGTLVAVSACGSNSHNGVLDIGTSSDSDGIMAAKSLGVSDTPILYDEASDFNGALVSSGSFYHLTKGTTVLVRVDLDGATGIENPTVVLTFLEG